LRDRDASLLPYQQLCFGFDIDQRGLTMQGQCQGSTIGTMLTDHQGATMLTSPLTTVPVVALLRVLVPDSEVQVPATQETRLLLGSLPLPPLVPSPRIGSRPPYSTLRLDDE
jgi:hypothetical protein